LSREEYESFMEERLIDLEKELVMNKQADLIIGES
jgi:hypothetical protein